jgi:hypothetical protein
MGPEKIILCSACKQETATTFIQGTLEIIGHGRYKVKCLNLALCDSCAIRVEDVTDNGIHLADVLVGGAQ